MLKRREFTLGGTAAVVAAGLGPVALFSGRRAAAGGFGSFTRARFDALLHTGFHIDAAAWEGAELIEVADGPPSAVVEQFHLVFQGPRDCELPSGRSRLRARRGP
ncbi:MAG: hypothetical protein O7G30_15865 [Proteobacteria bacterium]|nr:hypothetical protein [Pseudomonadota bacterium]